MLTKKKRECEFIKQETIKTIKINTIEINRESDVFFCTLVLMPFRQEFQNDAKLQSNVGNVLTAYGYRFKHTNCCSVMGLKKG